MIKDVIIYKAVGGDEVDNSLIFILLPAPDEPEPSNLMEQQERLRRLPLSGVRGRSPVRVKLPLVSYGTRSGAGPIAGPDLQNLLSFAGKVAPTLGTALVAWLGGRYGRKVRVKVGDVEVEANTVQDVEKLLVRVKELQKSSQA